MHWIVVALLHVLQSSKKAFYELDVEGNLGAQLSQKCLIEYPVIHVALNSDPEKFPVVVNLKSITSNASQPPPDVKLETPIIEEAVGVPFREEEIEEGEFVPWGKREHYLLCCL